MKTILLLSITLLTCVWNLHAERDAPFLYEIQTPDQTHYLYGTIHAPDARIYPLAATTQERLERADIVITEINLNPLDIMQKVSLLLLDGDATLAKLLPKDLYIEMDRELKRHGESAATFQKFKIWAAASSLVIVPIQSKNADVPPLDQYIWMEAAKRGKATDELESLVEQVAIFDSFTQEEQIYMLRETLDALKKGRETGRDYVKEIMDAWLAGDDAALEALIFEGFGEDAALAKKFKDRLMTQRDANMAERIDARLTANPQTVHFFAIGAGHLLKGGVADRLQAMGYTVERL